MRAFLQRALMAIACFVVLPAPRPMAQEPETVRFSFAPTEGEQWIRTGEHVSIRDLGNSQPISETRTLHELSLEYRRGDEGWAVVQIARRAQLLVDGVERASNAMQQTIGLPITLRVDESGKAVAAEGFRGLMRRFEDELPPAEFEIVSSQMSQERFEQTEIRGWNKKLDLVRGETVQIGEKWRVKDYHVVGQSALPVEGVVRFEGWAEFDGSRAFKILYDADNQGRALRRHGEGVSRTIDLTGAAGSDARDNLDIRLTRVVMVIPETGQVIYLSDEDQVDLQSNEFKDMPGTEGHFETRNIERWKRAD